MLTSQVNPSHKIPTYLKKRLQKRGLRIIVGGQDVRAEVGEAAEMDSTAESFSEDNEALLALNTLESLLWGEDWFLDEVRKRIRIHNGLEEDAIIPPADYKTLLNKNGHDSLIHVAQFYFFLGALQCKTASQLEAFIVAHNRSICEEIQNSDPKKADAIKARKISTKEITSIRLTLAEYGEPIFAVTELAKFLSSSMSTGTTGSLIKDLLKGGIFEQLAGPPVEGGDQKYIETYSKSDDTDPRRKLVRPKKSFLTIYKASLLMARQKILAGG